MAAVTFLAGVAALGIGCGPVQDLLTSPTAPVPAKRVVLPDYMTLRASKVCLTLDDHFPTGDVAADALQRLFPSEQGTFFVHNAVLPGDTLREQPRNLLNVVRAGDSLCYESSGTQAYAAAHPTPTGIPTATPEDGAWCKRISKQPDGSATFTNAWDAAQRLAGEHSDIPAERRTWYVRTRAGPSAKLQSSAAITDVNKLPGVVHPDDAICIQVPQ
jgi:hypothetical protein